MTTKEQIKLDSERTKILIKCKKCGHTIAMPFVDKTICSHCHNYVFKNKKIEFEYRLKENMYKELKNGNRSTEQGTKKVGKK